MFGGGLLPVLRRVGRFLVAAAALGYCGVAGGERVEFGRMFAPAEGWVTGPERPFRDEVCLNGLWQFQPVAVPGGWVRDRGVAPELVMPVSGGWEAVPLKVPSAWNVNTWGAGRDVGEGSRHPYWPSSVYYPSYPARWDGVEMGWLRRTFRVPEGWAGQRVVLHFEAVGGHAEVYVNGLPAGTHFDRFLPFEVDVTGLVNWERENELLVGVRGMRLFDLRSPTYKHMRVPYPPGSNCDNLNGIWQDVFLLGLPAMRAADVFVKPWVSRDTLEAEVTLRNDSGRRRSVRVDGVVHPWVNLAGTDVLDAPEPKWRLDPPVLALPAVDAILEPGEVRVVSLAVPVAGRLALWSPDAPRLHGLVLTVSEAGAPIDRSYTRFGWRECRIEGGDFLLNGAKLRMFGDLLHPFGPFVNSRRYVWAWYRMIKDMHGNAVRPHAQPHPRHSLDLADEMGLLVLDETALFGSSLQLNFEAPAAWDRYAAHFDNLILRDRNHPSVFGWSWGNELFAIFLYDDAISAGRTDAWYGNMSALGARGRRLDPTRDWFSCDGDEDVRGSMPVWNKHFGHGLPPPDAVPHGLNKPLMVGESGGTYYARPAQLAAFNGPRAYDSYRGRNEALAIDLYRNIVELARPRLAFFSPAETAWFGLEHLPFGYDDFSRLPDADDGVWFPPFEEGRPGVQIERLPPYVCTLNPGWDPRLPLYRPLPLFEAQQAAQAPGGPLPSPWDHSPESPPPPLAVAPPTIAEVAFAGDTDGALHRRLRAWGVPLRTPAATLARLLIVDGATLSEAEAAATRERAEAVLERGGAVWIMLQDARAIPAAVERLLPAGVALSDRPATALTPAAPHPWTTGLDLPTLYFAEDPADRLILRHGLHGPFVEQGTVLLQASNTDWSLFHNVPENAKCAAVVLYEHLEKPPGAAMVHVPQGRGAWLLSTIRMTPDSAQRTRLWQTLFRNLGVRLDGNPSGERTIPTNGNREHVLLLDGPLENQR